MRVPCVVRGLWREYSFSLLDYRRAEARGKACEGQQVKCLTRVRRLLCRAGHGAARGRTQPRARGVMKGAGGSVTTATRMRHARVVLEGLVGQCVWKAQGKKHCVCDAGTTVACVAVR